MSRFIAIILFFALVLQTGFKVVIYFGYEINKELITQKYCENKAKPEMKCNGKCHLNKLLKEDDKRNEPAKNPVKEQAEISPFVQHEKQIFKIQLQTASNFSAFYFLRESEGKLTSIFHPPSGIL